MRFFVGCTVAMGLVTGGTLAEERPSNAPVVPITRTDVKRALGAWPKVTPRLPLPALTAEDLKKQAVVNNGRMRLSYLPSELRNAEFSREPDPGMSLDNTFKTELFWIVSRVSNCRY